jgi:uncharacterized protein
LSFYLDTSVLVPLFCEEPKSKLVGGWAGQAEMPFSVSDFAVAEFCSALSKCVRMGIFDQAYSQKLITSFDRWRNIHCTFEHIQPADIESATQLVQQPQPKLLVPDAIHLAICQRLELTLVTLDKELLTIAAREGVAAIYPA